MCASSGFEALSSLLEGCTGVVRLQMPLHLQRSGQGAKGAEGVVAMSELADWPHPSGT